MSIREAFKNFGWPWPVKNMHYFFALEIQIFAFQTTYPGEI